MGLGFCDVCAVGVLQPLEMVSGFDDVCATWTNRGDGVSGVKCGLDSALCGLTSANPLPNSLSGVGQASDGGSQPAHEVGGGAVKMAGGVFGKMNGLWRERCLAWAL